MRRALALVAVVAVLIAAGGCSSGSGSAAAPPGPYAAGVTTATVDNAPVDIWYPAERASTAGHPPDAYDVRDWLPPVLRGRVKPAVFTFTTDAYRDLPAAAGPFPLVLFAHGLYSFRDQSTFLTTWLASWGYVVAAPELPARDLTAFFARDDNAVPGAPSDAGVLADARHTVIARLGPAVVSAGRVSVIGHSQGGIDAMQAAGSPDVVGYVALAAGFRGSHPPLPAVPSLYIAGGDDHAIPPALVRAVYDSAPSPKRLVVLDHAGHLAFTDLCLVGVAAGGLGALGRQLGVALAPGSPFTPSALDGCTGSDLQRGFSRIRHEVLRALRASPVGR